MNKCSPLGPLHKSVEVHCSPKDAFRIFTQGLASWWPLQEHSVSQEEACLCAFEERVGGALYEQDTAGNRHIWGTVRHWESPRRLIFSWHPGRKIEVAQEIEVRFRETPSGALVELEHRGWEALGDEAGKRRDQYDKGWDIVFNQLYAERCQRESTQQS